MPARLSSSLVELLMHPARVFGFAAVVAYLALRPTGWW